MIFDANKPFWVRPEFVQQHVQDAWIAQFDGDSWLSRILKYGTQGTHSHSAMVRRNSSTSVDILEVREFYGGRAKPLSGYFDIKGRIDFFSPCKDGIYRDVFSAAGAVDAMHKLTAHGYGYYSVSFMALRRFPLLWRFFPVPIIDDLPEDNDHRRLPFCSEAVATAMQRGGGVDVVPRCPNASVSPNDLTRSMFFEYEFSMWSPWAEKNWVGPADGEIDKYGLQVNEKNYLAKIHSKLP